MKWDIDQTILFLKLSFNSFKCGKSYWKHNNTLLTDKEYLKTVDKHNIETKKQYAISIYYLEEIDNIPNPEIQFAEIQFTVNDQLFLAVLLMEIRGKSSSHSSYKYKERNTTE